MSHPHTAFKPTFLYIKQHSVTGKLYFGKTTSANPISYKGSGTYWKSHISKHGKEYVQTPWFCLFYDKVDCQDFAKTFSEQEDIVRSEKWANLIPENGMRGGGRPGKRGQMNEEVRQLRKQNMKLRGTDIIPPERRQKYSVAAKGKTTWIAGRHHTEETKLKQSSALIGRIVSEETRARQSASLKGKKLSAKNMQGLKKYFENRSIIKCPHCDVESKSPGNMTRFHFNNCKSKPILQLALFN